MQPARTVQAKTTAGRWLDRIMIVALLVMLGAATVFLFASRAKAQPVTCFPFAQLRDGLKARYHETAIGGGIYSGGQSIVQVYASAEGATFTILAIQSDGLACVIAGGKDWQPGTLPVGGQEG